MRWAALAIAVGGVYLLSRRAKAGGGGGLPMTTQYVASNMKFPSRGTTPVKGIVIHVTMTRSPASTVRVLEGRGLSTDFEVDKAGRVYQYNRDLAGRFSQATGAGANRHVIAIDLTNSASGPWPDAQVQATRDLVHQLARQFGFAVRLAPDGVRKPWREWVDGSTVFRHRNFVAKSCPGTFPFDALA